MLSFPALNKGTAIASAHVTGNQPSANNLLKTPAKVDIMADVLTILKNSMINLCLSAALPDFVDWMAL